MLVNTFGRLTQAVRRRRRKLDQGQVARRRSPHSPISRVFCEIVSLFILIDKFHKCQSWRNIVYNINFNTKYLTTLDKLEENSNTVWSLCCR